MEFGLRYELTGIEMEMTPNLPDTYLHHHLKENKTTVIIDGFVVVKEWFLMV